MLIQTSHLKLPQGDRKAYPQAIDQWKVSPDGQSLVYGIRRNGTDEDYNEKLSNGRYGADNISWSDDSKGFYYTKYKQPQEGQAITEVVAAESRLYHELSTPQTSDQPGDTPGLPEQDWSYQFVDGNSWDRLGDDAQGRTSSWPKARCIPRAPF